MPELGDVSVYLTPELIAKGASHRDLRDARISAFMALAPALGQGFSNPEQFATVEAPVDQNAKHYHQLLPQSRYLELEDATGHYVFMNVAKNGLKRQAPMIFEDDPTVDRAAVHQRVAQEILQFLNASN